MLQFWYTSSLSVLLSSFNVCICADNIQLCIHAKLPYDSRLTLDPRVFAFFWSRGRRNERKATVCKKRVALRRECTQSVKNYQWPGHVDSYLFRQILRWVLPCAPASLNFQPAAEWCRSVLPALVWCMTVSLEQRTQCETYLVVSVHWLVPLRIYCDW